jgi:hypothetical protein
VEEKSFSEVDYERGKRKMEAARIIYEMETQLIQLVIKYLLRGNTESARWQAERLANLGAFRREALRVIGRESKRANKELNAELERAWRLAAGQIDSVAATFAEALPLDASTATRSILEIWEQRATAELGRTNAKLLSGAMKQYMDTVELATAKALTGSTTVRQAINETARGWAKAGIEVFRDSADRRWSTEAYAQTIVRSNIRQVTTETQMSRMQDYGLDLVEVSSHIGARPGCAPYQGQVWSLNGTTPGYEDRVLSKDTSYGDIAGLFGINCGHRMFPYVPGTRKTYTPYPTKENEEVYKESQQQRAIERSIRQAKREYSILSDLGDTAGAARAKERIGNRQSAMRDFIGETGRTRRRDREQIIRG